MNLARRESAADEIVLGLLDVVGRDPAITQRLVADELDIALGLANEYLKRCIRMGLIKVSQIPRRRYAYYLTPQGFVEKSRLTATYLSHSFSFFRQARTQCDAMFAAAVEKGVSRIVLLGAGDLVDIACLIVRERPIEVAGVVAWTGGCAKLAEDIEALGKFDGIFVTALVASQAAFEAACTIFNSERVFVPNMLRVHTPLASRIDAGQHDD